MNKILLMCSLVLLLSGVAGAVPMADVHAYPVPYNPNVDGGLEIYIPSGTFSVTFFIYDINGDLVTNKSFSSASYTGTFPTSYVAWNGRTSRGGRVKAGLYIIKVVIENESTGDYGKKIIRILVKR